MLCNNLYLLYIMHTAKNKCTLKKCMPVYYVLQIYKNKNLLFYFEAL